MTKETREREARNAVDLLDAIVPGKVRVYTEYCDETNAWYIVGAYQSYMELGEKKTVTAVTSFKREKMDRYYSVDVFMNFFKQRCKFMNASPEEQRAYEGHPAMYGGGTHSYTRLI